MFSKILIANRGEIAVRIIRACKEMGLATIAVCSTADRNALHVELADEGICIGGDMVSESYLNMESVLSAAICAKADAIHPGYGFLSENARFAEMCGKCGITFIGPRPETIRQMGDKNEARAMMREAGLPLIPGTRVLNSVAEAREAASDIGYPLLCKASAGGGGRGIRRVNGASELEGAFLTAQGEAEAAFGDKSVYLERLLTGARHIEVQLLCDNHGNILSLGERNCSIQRRRQKMIEECPWPDIGEPLRAELFRAARIAAAAVSYQGAGTVEFLVDRDERYYFMEMNTRLQVEHPITEAVTGIDIVKWQIRVAAGARLPFSQADVKLDGHAIECRILAENPEKGFLPSCGKITELHVPGGPWVRFDSAVYQGYTVPVFYDSMIGKLIVHAPTRQEAVRKMRSALCELVIVGIDHNADYLTEILSAPGFKDGSYGVDFLEG